MLSSGLLDPIGTSRVKAYPLNSLTTNPFLFSGNVMLVIGKFSLMT